MKSPCHAARSFSGRFVGESPRTVMESNQQIGKIVVTTH